MNRPQPARPRRVLSIVAVLAAAVLTVSAQTGVAGLREPAWAPDGKRLAVVFLDRIWTVLSDGKDGRELTRSAGVEREPAWSPDGRQVAFAADLGEGFDLYVVSSRGGAPARVTSLDGDERSPSWTPDNRLVFAHRPPGSPQWDLFLVDLQRDIAATPSPLTQSPDDEMHPRVSPDGRFVAFASNRDSEDGDVDIWLLRLLDRETASRDGAARRGAAIRAVRIRGYDSHPVWSPQGDRLAFYANRDGVGSTWIASVKPIVDGPAATAVPEPPPVLVSRHGGALSWSPDGRTLAIGEIPAPEVGYNGNPARDLIDAPPLFSTGRAHQLFTVPVPRPVDEGSRSLVPSVAASTTALTQAFDQTWDTLKRLYYSSGDAATQWNERRSRLRPRAEQARSVAALEDVIDDMVADQPLVKPLVTSSNAIVVSAHPLASEAGRLVLERGGNIVDAAIAVAFAAGVVEPDASGIGGDGQAVLFLADMAEPTVVEYKDQTPKAAALDNPQLFRGGRLVGDGPASANIPGVVAGLDYLYEHYGSGRVSWEELIAPAIRHAEAGFLLDQSLPSTIAAARPYFEKYPASARIFLAGRRVPRPGDRFVNRDYAQTLRVIAREGASAFYRGSLAARIAEDMRGNGGLITADDLAQYRAIERRPVSARYRGHVLYTGGPPVAAGVSVLEAFQVLGNYAPRERASATTDADYWHYLIESWKARDRITRIADPGVWAVDFESHLEAKHGEDLFRRIKPDLAARFPDDSDEVLPSSERIGSGTTAIVVADARGNMIALTNTLSTWGGSFYVSRGLGFLYNNHLRANRTAPGTYGQLLPLTRSNTANIPMLLFREREGRAEPRAALSSAGNAWIPAATYSVVAALIDGELSMQRAIEAPRFMVTRDVSDPAGNGARVEIEDRFPRGVLLDLTARGHRFQKIGRKGELKYGYLSGALIDAARGVVEGGADPRRSHTAVAVDGVRRLTQ
jgi:gamma-glutamyltranspeptidase